MQLFDPNDKLHLVPLQGRKFITFVGLQARLVDQGKELVGTDTEIVQLPTEDNDKNAVVLVTMTVKQGDTLATIKCVGDASRSNVGPKLVEATLRMSETRAQARCLRIATRAEWTSREEIGSLESIA